MLTRAIRAVGSGTISSLTAFGGAMTLFGRALACLRYILKDSHLYLRQARDIGVASLPLVLLIGAFTGMVSTWQANYSFGNVMPLKYLGVATFKAVIVELGPVLTGLVLAGRVGSSLSAELGTMKITEQVDALEVLAIDPVRYLVAPRLIAGLIMVPILVILAVFVSLWGGFFVAYSAMGVGFDTYFGEIPVFFKMKDVHVMLVKSATFGSIICLVGAWVGMNARGGAEGVGEATIKSFVASALLILFSDYFIATLMF